MTAVGPSLVTNGSFDYGTEGWKVSEPASTSLSAIPDGYDGAGVRLDATQPSIGVLNDVGNSVDDSSSGARYSASVWVRTDHPDAGVHLRVREFVGDSLRTYKEWLWLQDTNWHKINLSFVSELERSAIAVNVVGYGLSPERSLYIDELSMRTVLAGTEVASGEPTLTNGCTFTERGIPACGAYMGGAHGGNTDPTAWEESMDHRLGVHRTYWRPDQVEAAVSMAAEDLRHQRLPWISFKMPYSWTDMADGRGDAWTKGLATRLAAVSGPVWLAFHHEPEGDGDVQEWTRMQEHLAPIVRSAAPNVGYTVILTGWNQLYGDDEYHLSEIWPETTIDVAGFDIFQFYGEVRNGRMNTNRDDLREQYFEPLSAWAQQEGIAWGLAETGYADIASSIWPDWPQETYDDVVALGGVAFSYFDSDLNSTLSWTLADSAEKAEAYRDAIQGTPNLPASWT